MAVTAVTLDRAERTQMYRQVRGGVLVELAFDKVVIDGTAYYEPSQPAGMAGLRGEFQRGTLVAQEVFDQAAPALPVAVRPTQGQTAVWMYGGI